MKKEQNSIYHGFNNRPSLYDLEIPTFFNGKVIVFAHGFMGFKDWGAWSLVQEYFTKLGFGFCRFNFSHNGVGLEEPKKIVDLQAFSINSFWTEYNDFQSIINLLSQQLQPVPDIFLIGHSQGGSQAILQIEDPRIKKIVSWAAVAQLQNRFPKGEELLQWKKDVMKNRLNSRTGQTLSQNYSIYEDYCANESRLSIKQKLLTSAKPLLFIHGTADESVPLSEMNCLAEWSGQKGRAIYDANHTFGTREPWADKKMSKALEEVCRHTAHFLLQSHSFQKI